MGLQIHGHPDLFPSVIEPPAETGKRWLAHNGERAGMTLVA